ncbi:MAG: sigma-54-dependent Fis family transcriptional regulator [Desulfobacterales bacterium]|nr:sigma-54-dependent Fis family transcriptional regulator [Desulfobacterales bacterium]MCP4163302.1 sigma-54-dependent Fis family transcriptional regulator [Deltaproteobacteria bacterium]
MKKPKKILCIDDDDQFLKMLELYFEDNGYLVETALGGEKGLLAFENEKPDAVLVDLRMPNVDGFEVMETITKKTSDIPVIVVSGEGELADVIEALRLGAWNYQMKPIENMIVIKHALEQSIEKAELIKENKAYQVGLEQKLHNMVDNYKGFIFTCDNECSITYMNPSLIKYIGRDVTGEKCHKVFYDGKSFCINCTDHKLGKGQSYRQEIQIFNDGRWYDSIQSQISDLDGSVMEYQIILIDITEQKKKIQDLKEREEYFRKENIHLKASLSERFKFGRIIGKSKPMQEVYENIINASASDAAVIIYGESGTGKELVAKEIHENSPRKDKELVYVNCGAIPENLIESEFFGYKKGAFTGAVKDKHGLLDFANHGSLFMDEIGEIPLNMQVKLLRALEQGGYTPIGSSEVKNSDIRIIAATNRDLKDQVRKGLMRQDFLYRIHIIPINLPPLRERKDDIPFLVDHFLSKYDEKNIPPITPRIAKTLEKYDWPGNVRELQNTINRFVTLKKIDFMGLDLSDSLDKEQIDEIESGKQEKSLGDLIDQYEKRVLTKTLERYNWHKTKVASALNINRKTLFNKLKRYDLD